MRIGDELRRARVGAGLSLRFVGARIGRSPTQVMRIERGLVPEVSVRQLARIGAVVGLDVRTRAYPGGDPVRDIAQVRLLQRLKARLGPDLVLRAEVPLPIEGDLRAWDAEITGAKPNPWRARVEAETNIADGQALERRLALKLRDDPGGHLILLVSDTRSNRAALRSMGVGLRELLPLETRAILTALAAGRDLGMSGIVIL